MENSSRHCSTETDSEVKKIRERYIHLEKSWLAIAEKVKSLQDLIVPWKELTELYDKLCNSYERVNKMVERTETIMQERNRGNLSDIIHQLKVRGIT